MTPDETEALRSKLLQMEGLTDLTDESIPVRLGLLLEELERHRESIAMVAEYVRDHTNIKPTDDPVSDLLKLLLLMEDLVRRSIPVATLYIGKIMEALASAGLKLPEKL